VIAGDATPIAAAGRGATVLQMRERLKEQISLQPQVRVSHKLHDVWSGRRLAVQRIQIAGTMLRATCARYEPLVGKKGVKGQGFPPMDVVARRPVPSVPCT
jgi:hypothetical protein